MQIPGSGLVTVMHDYLHGYITTTNVWKGSVGFAPFLLKIKDMSFFLYKTLTFGLNQVGPPPQKKKKNSATKNPANYLLRGEETRRDTSKDVGHDHIHGLDVSQAEQDRSQAGQAPRIFVRSDPAMAKKDPQNMERRRARLIADDVGLKLGHGPHVVHHVSDDDHVGALSTMESHVFSAFSFFYRI
jgi:hypothetical protein